MRGEFRGGGPSALRVPAGLPEVGGGTAATGRPPRRCWRPRGGYLGQAILAEGITNFCNVLGAGLLAYNKKYLKGHWHLSFIHCVISLVIFLLLFPSVEWQTTRLFPVGPVWSTKCNPLSTTQIRRSS
ncbi:hypothetical protein CapIbe_010267 [Capra ibex]